MICHTLHDCVHPQYSVLLLWFQIWTDLGGFKVKRRKPLFKMPAEKHSTPARVRTVSSSPWISREPAPFSAGKKLYEWITKQTTLTMTGTRMLPARGAWGPARGADTVQLNPTLAETSAMLHKQGVLLLCPTRNERARQAQNAYPLFTSAGEGGGVNGSPRPRTCFFHPCCKCTFSGKHDTKGLNGTCFCSG